MRVELERRDGEVLARAPATRARACCSSMTRAQGLLVFPADASRSPPATASTVQVLDPEFFASAEPGLLTRDATRGRESGAAGVGARRRSSPAARPRAWAGTRRSSSSPASRRRRGWRVSGRLFEEVLIVGGEPPADAPGRRVADPPGPPLRAARHRRARSRPRAAERVLVLATDLPLVTPDLLLALVARPEADVVVPRDGDGRHTLCALYRRERVLAAAHARISPPDVSARRPAGAGGHRRVQRRRSRRGRSRRPGAPEREHARRARARRAPLHTGGRLAPARRGCVPAPAPRVPIR